MHTVIYTHGNVITLDDAYPLVEAMVVQNDRIAYVGEAQGAMQYRTPETQIIDLEGKTLIPGFNDNHLHIVFAGDYFSKPNLSGLSCEQIVTKLKAVEHELEPDEPLHAFGWDYPDCPRPHHRQLDKHFPHRPVALFQYSGHAVWANAAQLKQLKVTASSPNPLGGEIEKDAQNHPTGILKDKAVFPLHYQRFMRMNMNHKIRRRLVGHALDLFRKNGMTSVQDNTWAPFTVSHFNRLKRRDNLTCRISCWSHGDIAWARYWLEHQHFDPFWVRRGPRKYFIDGTFSTHTAMLNEPYLGEPENFGLPTMRPERLQAVIALAVRQNRQLACHAIGDGAISHYLNTLEKLNVAKEKIRLLRFRLEHAQLITPLDLQRLAEWGIHLAVQPSAMIDTNKDRGLLGEKRAQRAYPYRSILNAGIPLSFGSDVPGESRFKPLELIHMAVNRSSDDRISPLQALTAYTIGSARAEFMEKEKGTLTPGKLADFAVLSADPLKCPPDQIKEIAVEMTVVGGRIVYNRSQVPKGHDA